MQQTAQASSARADRPPADDPRFGSLSPIKPEQFRFEEARHLLQRAGFGGTPAQIRALASLGPEKAVDHLLQPQRSPAEPVRADQFDKDIIRPPTDEERRALQQARRRGDEDLVARFRAEVQSRERRDRRQIRDIQAWWLARMIESPSPMEEKLTLFWHGHFATSYRTIENSYHMFLQNQTFRASALGSFADLLHAIIQDPAMLAYLDNNDSRKGQPNENLARELMELFSLGVGQYTEADIKEGARALTGHTFDDDAFVFRKDNHDNGAKEILGRRGNIDGRGFVEAILQHRACAPFITSKLYAFLVADLPESQRDLDPKVRSILRTLSATLQGDNYQLRPMLRRLLLSEHFYSQPVVGQQIKSPVQLVVQAARSLLAPARDLSILLDALDLMGQDILFPPSVAGWAGGRTWINTSTMFVRHNVLTFMLTGRTSSGFDASASVEKFDPAPLLADLASTGADQHKDPAAVAEYLLRLTIGRVDPQALTTLIDLAPRQGQSLPGDVVTAMLLLITAMPEYQLC